MANRFLNNIKINDAYILPASDGLSGQFIATDGAGNLSFMSLGESGAIFDELIELDDVEINNVQQNDLLVWDNVGLKWKNRNELSSLNVATLNVSASVKTPIIHTGILATPKQITQDAVIEENHNAFLINTISVNATITVGTNSDLKIIDL